MTDQEATAGVLHLPEGGTPPVVVQLSDEFGDLRDTYLDYEAADDLARQLTESIPDELRDVGEG